MCIDTGHTFLQKRSWEDSGSMLNLEWAQRPPRSRAWFLSQRISPSLIPNVLGSLWVKRYVCVLNHFSHVQLFVTLWTVAHQAPLSMGFSRQEYWSGLPCPLPGDLPNSWIKPESFVSPAFAGRFFTTSATWDAPCDFMRYPQIFTMNSTFCLS